MTTNYDSPDNPFDAEQARDNAWHANNPFDDEDADITGYDPSNPFTREDWFAEQATKVAGDWEPDLWD